MRSILFTLWCYLAFQTVGQEYDLTAVRQAFHQAVLHDEESDSFHEYVGKIANADPTILAYQAVSKAMLARVLWNPFAKYSHVMKYRALMADAIKTDSSNIEIRFLRLSIEYNLPSFLSESQYINEDLKIILENLSSVKKMRVDPGYGRYIFYFLRENGLCTVEEIQKMKKSLDLTEN